MPMQEDLAAFFNVDEFGIEAVWSEAAEPLVVIFDNEYLEQFGITGSQPIALAIAADFPNVAEGQTLTISGVQYNIVTPQPDGTGLVAFILEVAEIEEVEV